MFYVNTYILNFCFLRWQEGEVLLVINNLSEVNSSVCKYIFITITLSMHVMLYKLKDT